MEPRNRFQGMNSATLCSLAGRYDNPIPPWFLAPIDSLQFQLSNHAPSVNRVKQTVKTLTESIEWYIEGQAFSLSYELAHPLSRQ
jgi:hypothetical protein